MRATAVRSGAFRLGLALLLLSAFSQTARAQKQKSPEMGYIYPAGGAAGTTVSVVLGGYDWTPDMQFFMHRPGMQLSIGGPPGPILVPRPPYWFGAKSYGPALPLPREVPASIVIPADTPPGPVFWQAANANGATLTGIFMVGAGPEVLEAADHESPQVLPALPVTVNGQVELIEEIDRYRCVSPHTGPVTCTLRARQLGAAFNAAIEIHDATGALVADAFDTEGLDAEITFAARAGAEYQISIRDVDFRGDRSYCYRLSLVAGPRVVAALPAAGRRGETRPVEFVGMGVATGAPVLESVTRPVTFPTHPAQSSFPYQLETPFGNAPAVSLLISDLAEALEPARAPGSPHALTLPAAMTGILDQPADEDLYTCTGTKGDVLALTLQSRRIGSPLDPVLVIRDALGKELARADDQPGSVDAGLEFKLPEDGTYTIAVGDMLGKAGTRAASYRLTIEPAVPDFSLQAAVQRLSVEIGAEKGADLAIKAVRRAGFNEPITLTLSGLPAGVTASGELVIPAGKVDLKIPLLAAADAASTAAPIQIQGTAKIGDATVSHTVLAPAAGNLAPRSADDNTIPLVLVSATLKPVCKVEPLEKDGGRSVHRGTTFPAPMVIERFGDFNGEIVLQMASLQSRHRQGISGHDVIVPPGVTSSIFPCYMPEWLETDRTSRLAAIGVAKVPDPKGNVRYLVADVGGQITMTIEGALLKISHMTREMRAPAGQPLEIPVKLSRSAKLAEPARLELVLGARLQGQFTAEPLTLVRGQTDAVFKIVPTASSVVTGPVEFGIRATVLQDGNLPCISQTTVPVDLIPAAKVSAAVAR